MPLQRLSCPGGAPQAGQAPLRKQRARPIREAIRLTRYVSTQGLAPPHTAGPKSPVLTAPVSAAPALFATVRARPGPFRPVKTASRRRRAGGDFDGTERAGTRSVGRKKGRHSAGECGEDRAPIRPSDDDLPSAAGPSPIKSSRVKPSRVRLDRSCGGMTVWIARTWGRGREGRGEGVVRITRSWLTVVTTDGASPVLAADHELGHRPRSPRRPAAHRGPNERLGSPVTHWPRERLTRAHRVSE